LPIGFENPIGASKSKVRIPGRSENLLVDIICSVILEIATLANENSTFPSVCSEYSWIIAFISISPFIRSPEIVFYFSPCRLISLTIPWIYIINYGICFEWKAVMTDGRILSWREQISFAGKKENNFFRFVTTRTHEVFKMQCSVARTGDVFRKCDWVLKVKRFVYRDLTKGNDINYIILIV
jgi:hypothetical protein